MARKKKEEGFAIVEHGLSLAFARGLFMKVQHAIFWTLAIRRILGWEKKRIGKKKERVSEGQLAEETNYDRSSIGKALKGLRKRNVMIPELGGNEYPWSEADEKAEEYNRKRKSLGATATVWRINTNWRSWDGKAGTHVPPNADQPVFRDVEHCYGGTNVPATACFSGTFVPPSLKKGKEPMSKESAPGAVAPALHLSIERVLQHKGYADFTLGEEQRLAVQQLAKDNNLLRLSAVHDFQCYVGTVEEGTPPEALVAGWISVAGEHVQKVHAG